MLFQLLNFIQQSLLRIGFGLIVIQLEVGPEPEAFGPPVDPNVGSEHWARHTAKRTEFDIYPSLSPVGVRPDGAHTLQ